MATVHAARLMPAAKKREWTLAGIGPVTLLIASGIVLVAGMLIATGLVAGHLREQSVVAARTMLAQLDSVLAEAGVRSLRPVDEALGDIARRIRSPDALTAADTAEAIAAPAIAELLRAKTQALPQLAGIAVADAAGAVLNHAGDWPAGETRIASRDYFAALRAHPAIDVALGAPLPGAVPYVALARQLHGARGEFIGVAVAAIPVAEFDGFYRNIPLGADGIVSLVRDDGVVLAQYPPQPAALGRPVPGARLKTLLAESSKGAIDGERPDGTWAIQSMQALPGFPAAVVIGRDGDAALLDWSHQALLFGAFAVSGALGIGLMIQLIARQLRVHGALASARADKIESEHARLVAEAELLKKERLSVLGQLTATVAHELRNPLSAIRNTLFTLKEMAGGGGLKLDRPVARMERSIERCDRIIADLLEYARNRDLRRTDTAFDAWIGEVLAELPVPATVALVEEFGAGDTRVAIDTDRIRRVVVNLIDNAAQALAEMPAGGEARIAVRTACDGEAVELTVADTGPGIAPEHLPRIFEPLFSTKSFGTGLGLATVQQIVAQHGGRIDVRSTPGTGTAFTVRLPRHGEAEQAA